MVYIIVILISLACTHSSAAPENSTCKSEEVDQALSEIPALAARVRNHKEAKPFGAVNKIYFSLPKCVNSALGEAISDLIVGAIATNWPTVPDLFVMMNSNPEFAFTSIVAY